MINYWTKRGIYANWHEIKLNFTSGVFMGADLRIDLPLWNVLYIYTILLTYNVIMYKNRY